MNYLLKLKMIRDRCRSIINNGDWLWNPKDEALIFILGDSEDKCGKNTILVSRKFFGYFYYPKKSLHSHYLAQSYKLPDKRFLKYKNQMNKIKDAYINLLCIDTYHYYCFNNNIHELPYTIEY